MGAQEFRTSARGKSLKEAYDSAVSYAHEEYGHQEGYSGEINSTGSLKDLTDEFKKSKKSLGQFINEAIEGCPKSMCYAVCTEEPITNKNKTKSQVKHIVTAGTKKWILKYVVTIHSNQIGAFLKKGDAVTAARAYTERTQNSTTIVIEKRLEKGSSQVAEITYKKAPNEREGKWIFFGLAGC